MHEGGRKMRTVVSLLVAAGLCTLAAASDQFNGRWVNEDPNTRSITSVEIRSDQEKLKVRIWGACRPVDCEWGESTAEGDNQRYLLTWKTSFATRTQDLTLEGDNRLRIVTRTTFTDNSGRPNSEVVDLLRRQ
jgi:hypothetical protein